MDSINSKAISLLILITMNNVNDAAIAAAKYSVIKWYHRTIFVIDMIDIIIHIMFT